MERAVSADYRAGDAVSGEFVTFGGERYYAIRNVDQMAPFFISVISSADHWLFVSSTGGLTAGRVSPETALFPYIPVDRVHEFYGVPFEIIAEDLASGKELRVVDFDGPHIFNCLSFSDLGHQIQYEH